MSKTFKITRPAPWPRHAGLMQLIQRLTQVRRQRIDLASLEPHLLNDIGVTEAQARTEANRSIWDAPEHWR
ncbi:DUF1127 domain-containing protein [Yoonia sp. R2331]|uniref:DUF1127 domain-containing protein n=1 Tax=Yoonia sp. R2331 TaxID=3237238 RepID=UPI0034E4E07A